jgi:hypothetical protein
VTFIKKQRQGKTIGIVGSRRRDSRADHRACVKAFNKLYKPGDRIVSGGCPKGGDRFAELIAKRRGLTITIHYPDWDGPAKIAEECDILIALPADDRTGGTEDTIRKAAKLKKKIVLVLERT